MQRSFIPSAEDAQKMRVTMRYLAEDQLTGLYLNDRGQLGSLNLLTQAMPTDTSTSTEPGVVELTGFKQGSNFLTLVVKSTRGPDEARRYAGFAAAFDARCVEPAPPVPVPAMSQWGLMPLGMRRLLRRS